MRVDPLQNLLGGMRCPNCGEDEALFIMVSGMALVTRTVLDADHDHTWGPSSRCECPTCGFVGTVHKFSGRTKQ